MIIFTMMCFNLNYIAAYLVLYYYTSCNLYSNNTPLIIILSDNNSTACSASYAKSVVLNFSNNMSNNEQVLQLLIGMPKVFEVYI